MDLNGDGFVSDSVLHLFHDGIVENTGLAVWGFAAGVEGLLALGRLEARSGEDWNGDGDEEDYVLHLLELATGALTSTRVSCSPTLSISPRRLPLLVEEDTLGLAGRDQNGDGDQQDGILHRLR